jgi:hypothetical protein
MAFSAFLTQHNITTIYKGMILKSSAAKIKLLNP